MNYDTFVDQVARRSGTSARRAEELTRATLATLTERLTGGEVLDLAVRLPEPLRSPLRPTPGTEAAEQFGAAEFVARVAVRAGIEEPAARSVIGAVFATLRTAVTDGEFDELVVRLPRDYRDLVEPALAPGTTLRRA
ncbi:DUF2267 domain-containing protein [Micromonospora endophytica]|uniref:DUF2267 domain-containing protein n=1 Tax=Micromonospora endophytica TaxID=515350 RepID=A0A2W2CQH3_9ACTN|nr:DUF2267 domain-containing protein [Micromonospora endophytica]PZF87416.1 DUF2267 domain-containing protein [Micromonospora endophytica]RIW48280.1 DUF2267 domain-containing protein [Micromonospora endophytica]